MWLPGFSRDFSRVLRGSRTSEFIICNLIYVKMAVSFEIFCYSPVAHALRHYLLPNGGVDAWENHKKGPLHCLMAMCGCFLTAQVGWLAFDQSRGRCLHFDGGGLG